MLWLTERFKDGTVISHVISPSNLKPIETDDLSWKYLQNYFDIEAYTLKGVRSSKLISIEFS